MDSLARKRTGSYYTDMELTDIMMHELVSNLIMASFEIEESLKNLVEAAKLIRNGGMKK